LVSKENKEAIEWGGHRVFKRGKEAGKRKVVMGWEEMASWRAEGKEVCKEHRW